MECEVVWLMVYCLGIWSVSYCGICCVCKSLGGSGLFSHECVASVYVLDGKSVCGVQWFGGCNSGMTVYVYMGCVVQEIPRSDHNVWIGLGVLSTWVLSLGLWLCAVCNGVCVCGRVHVCLEGV